MSYSTDADYQAHGSQRTYTSINYIIGMGYCKKRENMNHGNY